MAQIPFMLHLSVNCGGMLPEISLDTVHDQIIILIYNGTVRCRQHIIGTAFSVQPQCQRTVFFSVAEGKFHFIAVCCLFRAGFNSLEYIIRLSRLIHLTCCPDGIIQKLFHLFLFHLQLFFVGHGLVGTASALRELGAHGLSCFQRGLLFHLQNASAHSAASFFLYKTVYFLSRDTVFHGNQFTLRGLYPTEVGEIYFCDGSFKSIAFFHSFSPKSV